MTGLLKGLAARFAPQATAPIQPRPAFRFEGEREAEGFQEIAAETRAAAPARDIAPPGQIVVAEPTRSGAPQAFSPATAIAPTQPAGAARPETPRAVQARQQTLGRETLGRAPDAHPSVEAESATPTAEDVVRTPQPKVERTRTHETFHERVETVQIAQSTPGLAERTVQPPSAPPAVPEGRLPEAALAETGPAHIAESTTPAPSIRIGRIEVRAPAKPAPPPTPPRPAPAPSTQTARPASAPAAPARSGLTDYLGWRR